MTGLATVDDLDETLAAGKAIRADRLEQVVARDGAHLAARGLLAGEDDGCPHLTVRARMDGVTCRSCFTCTGCDAASCEPCRQERP